MTFELAPQKQADGFARVEELLGKLREDTEKRGWTFYIEPSKQLIPEFLGNYRPDAIGVGPDGGIIIEIKTNKNPSSEFRLAEISKKVSEQKGWEFRVFYLPSSPISNFGMPAPTFEQVRRSIAEAHFLLVQGHERAALMIAWATLEALARLAVVHRGGTVLSVSSPVQIVQALAQEGYLEDMDALRLRNLAKLRSQVVHGNLSVIVSPDDVRRLISDIETVTANLEEVA